VAKTQFTFHKVLWRFATSGMEKYCREK